MPASGLRWKAAAKVAWAAVLSAAATACQDAAAPASTPLSVRSVAVAADSGSIFRSLTINLSDPVGVQVDYWAPATPHLRVIDRGMTADHAVFLPALRAGHAYDYEVRPFIRGFPRDPVYHGQLVTDPLPAPTIYAPIIGSARRLSGGVTVVNFGTPAGILGSSGPIAAYDVSLDGTVRWSLHITGSGQLNYRTTPLDDIAGEQVVPMAR